jgi:S1-C subfamily serine protease
MKGPLLPLFCTICVLSSGCVHYSAVGRFTDYNEVLKGAVNHNLLAGTGQIQIAGEVSGMQCQGNSWVTYIPPSGSCVGQQGKALLTCTDGRVVDCDWIATGCTSGWGVGRDQQGNSLAFAFGMNEQQAQTIVSRELRTASARPELPPVYKPKETRKEYGYSTGTGFFVSTNGYLVTNFHVVDEANEYSIVTFDGQVLAAKLIRGDPANDVAVLKVEASTQPLSVVSNNNLARGEDVFTLGYPLVVIQGQDQKATFGRVNSLSGIADDIRFVQIDVPIQPGNSGGPLINSNGEVVGVVTATLDALVTLRLSGRLPQNVNYAVKSDYLAPLLRSVLVDKWESKPASVEKKEVRDLIKNAERSVALVIAR